jgi:thioredoxin-dependent peroxiredoxin
MQSTPESGETLPSIDIGDTLPTLTLKNEKNEDIQIADLASERGVVLFLVPKVDTRKDIPHFFPSPELQANGFVP